MWNPLEVGVVAQRIQQKIARLCECFDARVAGSNEHEGELPPPLGIGAGRIRGFEPTQHVVAEVNSVGKRLESDAVLCQPGDRECSGDGADGYNHAFVRHLGTARLGYNARYATLEIDALHRAEQKIGVRAHLSKRHDHVTWLDGARSGLRQQRRKQTEVVWVDDGRTGLAEQPGSPASGETTTKHKRAATCLTSLRGLLIHAGNRTCGPLAAISGHRRSGGGP